MWLLQWVAVFLNLSSMIILSILSIRTERLRKKMLEELAQLQSAKNDCIITTEALREVIAVVRENNVVNFPGRKK